MKLTNISNSYILDNVNLEVPRHDLVTILGPSGSGKTTLLKVLAGIEKYTSGILSIDTRNIGMVFQHYNLFPKMTARENVEFPLRVKKLSLSLASVYLELVGMAEHANKMPEQLSGGQQQRVALARALCYTPDIVLLDEPLGSLDVLLRNQLQQDIRQIQQETKSTMLYVTHDIAEAFVISDSIAIMQDGKVVQHEVPRNLYHNPATPWVDSFIKGGLSHLEQIKEIVN